MRKQTRKILLKIDLMVFLVGTVIMIALKYSDTISNADLFHKYAFPIGIPTVIAFILMMWYAVKIMISGKRIN